MTQCAMEMQAVTGLRNPVSSAAGIGAAPMLASMSQGWCAVNVAQLRVGRLELLRQPNLVSVRAAGGPEGEGDDISGYGLGGKGSFFGFGRFQELQVGRLAMVGFAATVVMEVITGKGVFGQLGINPLAVKGPLLAGFLFLLIGGLLGGYVVINNPPTPPRLLPTKATDCPETFSKPTTPRTSTLSQHTPEKGKEPYVSDLDLPPPKK